MARRATVKVSGLRELQKALGELPKATGKNVVRRVLKKIADPIAADMRAKAPDDPATGGMDLKGSIAVSTKLSKNQAKLHRKETGGAAAKTPTGWKSSPKTLVELFVGAGPVPHGHLQEFGTAHHGPQPFARPAWDAAKGTAIETVKTEMWSEIEKAAKRLARKSAKG